MPSLVHRLTTLTAAATLLSSLTAASSLAAQFDQQPIAADQVVAVAEPVNNGRFYNLLILEQLSTVRRCWQEQSGSPTTIDPLLLTFDFAGLCGRSSDSNGYSVRIGGEDLSLRYRLQITRQAADLVLQAVPSFRYPNLPTLEIGRTNGIADGFLKIELNPGWQMGRRVYNGQPLNHIYLTNDQPLDAVIATSASQPPTSPAAPPPSQLPSQPPATLPPPAPPLYSRPLPPPGAPSSPTPTGDYRVVVPGNSNLLRLRVGAVAPGAFQTTVNGQSVIQAGRFSERNRADDLQRQLTQANLSAQVVEGDGIVPSSSPPSSSPSAGPAADAYYQVIVASDSEIVKARVSSVEPGAFSTTVNGRSVIQVGLFRERNRADDLMRRLAQANISAQIIQGSGPIATNPTPSSPPPAPSRPTPSPPRQGQIVVMIDPGHGGRDPGAVGIGGLQEKELTTWISRRIQQVLEQNGIRALMTRDDDRTVELQTRVDIAERANATIFVSIHANAISLSRPEVNGLETYYYSSGLNLARVIHNRVLQSTDLRDRGVRQARFYVIRNTSMPAVLVETGYVTGREDVNRFLNLAARQQIADAIAQGIIDYLR
jgi:N-acetylmuramoyl-L-alanine amidase